jgi:hypothetical protein
VPLSGREALDRLVAELSAETVVESAPGRCLVALIPRSDERGRPAAFVVDLAQFI